MKNIHKKSPIARHKNDRGSILIFVVGILVLLALSATAYLATARSDRVASKQNESNIQIDMLVEAMIESSKAAIINDDAIKSKIADFTNYTSLGSNAFLAARIPNKINPALVVGPNGTDPAAGTNPNRAVWSKLTGPILGSQYESPTGQTTPFAPYGSTQFAPYGITFLGSTSRIPTLTNTNPIIVSTVPPVAIATGTTLFAGDADGDGIADSLPEKLPLGTLNGVTYYAYFRIIDNGSAINVNTAMSRDSDFSGIAATPQMLPDGTPLTNNGYFTSNIGLAEMLFNYPTGALLPNRNVDNVGEMGLDFVNMMEYRLHGVANPGLWTGNTQTVWPIDSAGVVRDDFAWYSIGDAMDRQLAQRTANPGQITGALAAQAFTINDAISLSYKFTLKSSDTSLKSELETRLASSLYTHPSVISIEYDPTAGQGLWFNNLFNFDAEVSASRFPLRSLLTAAGDIRNLTPTVYTSVGFSSSYLTSLGVITASTGKNVPAYIPPAVVNEYPALNPPPGVTGGIFPGGMAEFPVGGAAKVSILTAPFSELYRAFWQVFSTTTFTGLGDDHGTIFGDAGFAGNFYTNGPYEETLFDSNANTPIAANQALTWPRMFRSPIRSVADAVTGDSTTGEIRTYANAIRMSADQVVLLRSAIAAQNLDAMRFINRPTTGGTESPDKVRYRDIVLKVTKPASGATNPTPYPANVRVRVFGQTRQPYISEVFGHTDTTANAIAGQTNTNGYIAIELYNPYDVDIDISNCRFATIHRLLQTQSPLPLEWPSMVLTDTTTPADPAEAVDLTPLAPVIVPSKGYLVLDNFDPSGNDDSAAKYVPLSAGSRPVAAVFVPNLHKLFNREFILMRPLDATITAGAAGAPSVLTYINPAGVVPSVSGNFMPLDSYDLSSLTLFGTAEDNLLYGVGNTGANVLKAWHYQRETSDLVATRDQWRFVYPGRYDGAKADHAPGLSTYPRQMGTAYARCQLAPNEPGWYPSTPPQPDHGLEIEYWNGSIGNAQPDPAPTLGLPNSNVRQGSLFSVQLINKDWPGKYPKHLSPDPSGPLNSNVYPYGQFARLGDIMQVPFIGSYIIYSDVTTVPDLVYEVNPITMDAAMAEDGDVNDDPVSTDTGVESREQIGRFAPLRPTTDSTGTPNATVNPPAGGYSDYADAANTAAWRYRFATRLFDFFSLTSPADDYLPNVKAHATIGYENSYGFYDATGIATGLRLPAAVQNALTKASNHTQDNMAVVTPPNTADDLNEQTLPVRGQININTASWKVLSMIPWLPSRDYYTFDVGAPAEPDGPTYLDPTPNGVDDSIDIAKAIAYWRDGNLGAGAPLPQNVPFKSMFDLYTCGPVRFVQRHILTNHFPRNAADVGTPPFYDLEQLDQSGAIDPTTGVPEPLGDDVRYDFEEQYLLMNRVSNLITTRSDTFTVYILLQGWRNAGTPNPELVTQRRASFIFDRSQYDATNGKTSTYKIPTN